MSEVIVDIREEGEVAEIKIGEAINLPMSNADALTSFINDHKGSVLIMCRSGKRARMLLNKLSKNLQEKCKVYDGGILEYSKSNPVIRG